MQFIQDVELLAGKTIKHAKLFDWDDTLIITFADNTYICITAEVRPEYAELDLTRDADKKLKLEAGIITQAEYNELKAHEAQQQIDRAEAQERLYLAVLLEKYGTPAQETTK